LLLARTLFPYTTLFRSNQAIECPMPVCSGMGTVCGSGFVRPPDLQFMQCDAQGAVVGAHTQLPRRDRLRYLDADSLSRPGQLKVQQDFTGLIPESESLFLITQLQGEALADVGAERLGFQQYLQVAGDRCRQLQIDIGGI